MDQRRAAAGHGQRLGRRLGQRRTVRRTRRPAVRGDPHPDRWRLRRDYRRRHRQRRKMDRGFQSGRDRLAVLHVSGQPCDHALKDALAYPTDADAHGGTLTIPGGELALFSSALDEVRDNGVPLVRASPGPTPRAYRPASMSTPRAEVVTGLLVALPAGPTDWRCGGGPAWLRMRSSPVGCCRRSRYGGIAVLPVTARLPRRDAQSTIEESPE
jgi:hypothetical protein